MLEIPAGSPETRETRLHREAVDLLTFLERQERLTYLHPADGPAPHASRGQHECRS